MSVVAGIDFGTLSVRVSIVDSERGRLGFGVAEYPVLRPHDRPDHASQSHAAHLVALQKAFLAALESTGIDGRTIAALAIDTTGSTVVAVDERLEPLDDYYLWCDHRAWREAGEITHKAQALPAFQYCGGAYSAEWGFAKLLHWLRHSPALRERFHTAVEHCDLIAATLCGIRDPAALPRSVCAMGHKWMWNAECGGLPSQQFLSSVDPLLDGVRQRLDGRYLTSDRIAGHVSAEWAQRLGLTAGIPMPVGALDAHWDAIGAGCRLGDVVNVIGTSSCIMALSESRFAMQGISGVMQGSIHPGKGGIEAGLAAVGDLFDAIARRAQIPLARLSEQIQDYRAGQTGMLRIAWDNGDRSVLADPKLRGAAFGWRLNHGPADELFAAIEGTALQTRIILERLASHGVPIDRIINGGGIPARNPRLNQVYADVLGKPVLIPAAESTGLGAAIFAFLAAGTFATVDEAQAALCPRYRSVEPDGKGVATYDAMYEGFRDLYFKVAELGCAHSGPMHSERLHA